MTPEQLDEIENLAADGAFKAAGYYALPLVKALREARTEVERLKESVANLDALYVSRTDALRESEAEVERLRSVLRLLWEEAQDKAAIRDSTTDAVEAALKADAP